ncbi:hypothetical protein LTS08_003994 [Lithohypha guttulata]|nr:hypothetical protein LTS08_003994 [Lithohypha guttulata]
MRGRYEVADLIKLSKSPLVEAPASLPPKEEWMGARNGTHERTKTNDEEDESVNDRRTGASNGTNGRSYTRNHTEYNASDRPRRRFDEDEEESRSRRDPDRPRWGGRDTQSDTPWSRREKRGDAEDDERKDSPAWRRGPRDRDNERTDKDPEWVDPIEASGPSKGHTHEEFMQWMAKMKNKKSEDEPATPAAVTATEVSDTPSQPHPRVVSESSVAADKFFAKFEDKKPSTDMPIFAARPVKSRFASIFGSKDESKPDVSTPDPAATTPSPVVQALQPPVELEQPPPNPDNQKKAKEKVAFDNLLAMLKQNQTQIAQGTSAQPSKSPFSIAELSASMSPSIEAATSHKLNNKTPVQSHTPNLSLDRLIESRSPAHPTYQNQSVQQKPGAQDLLDLLKRSSFQEQPQPLQQLGYHPYHEQRMPPPPPGLGPPLISTRRDVPRPFFEDPTFTAYHNEREYQPRNSPPGNNVPGGLGGLFAAINNKNYAPNAQEEQRSHPGPPPGLQRPPGFENPTRPPPGSGWPTNLPQRQSAHQYNIDIPPPYEQARSIYSQAPQQQPIPQNPQRKPTGGAPMMPGYSNVPPGFQPSSTYAPPTSPESGIQYAIRDGNGISERDRQPQQQNPFLARMGMGGQARDRGVPLPPGFR